MSTRARLLALVLVMVGAVLSIPSAVGAAGHDAPRASDQHFIFLSNKPSEKATDVAIGLGTIHARGIDKVINNHTDKLIFPKGTLTISHHRVGKPAGHFDKKTCYGQFTEHGVWTVASGSGAYSAANGGGGTYRVVGTVVACRNQRPKFFTVRIDAPGNLALTQGTP